MLRRVAFAATIICLFFTNILFDYQPKITVMPFFVKACTSHIGEAKIYIGANENWIFTVPEKGAQRTGRNIKLRFIKQAVISKVSA